MRHISKILIVLLAGMILTGCGRYEYREGIDKLKNGEYESAIEQFEKAIKEERNVGDSYRGIGIAKWETEDYEGAVTAFEKALDNGSEETGTIYNFLGACKMKLGDSSAAIDYYKQGLKEEDTTDEMAQEMRFNMIASYEALGDWESARAELAQYIIDYPDDEQAAKEAEFLETR